MLADETDYLNDDDEDKDFWLHRHTLAKQCKARQAEERRIFAEQNRENKARLKQTGARVDTWARASYEPIEARLKVE